MLSDRRPFYGPPPPVPDWMVMIVDTVAESMELGWFCTDLCDHAAGTYQCEQRDGGDHEAT